MADERIIPPKELGKLLLEPLNHAIAAGSRKALDSGIPTEKVLEMHLNNISSVIAMIEPPEARVAAIQDVVHAIPGLVRQHVDARMTTPGGIKLPVGVRV